MEDFNYNQQPTNSHMKAGDAPVEYHSNHQMQMHEDSKHDVPDYNPMGDYNNGMDGQFMQNQIPMQMQMQQQPNVQYVQVPQTHQNNNNQMMMNQQQQGQMFIQQNMMANQNMQSGFVSTGGSGGGDSGGIHTGGKFNTEHFSSSILKKDKENRIYVPLEKDSAGKTLLIIAVVFLCIGIVAFVVCFIAWIITIALLASGASSMAGTLFLALSLVCTLLFVMGGVVFASTFPAAMGVQGKRMTFDLERDLLIVHYVSQLFGTECTSCECCSCEKCGVKDEYPLSKVRVFEMEKKKGLKKMFGARGRVVAVPFSSQDKKKALSYAKFEENELQKKYFPLMNKYLEHLNKYK